MISVVKPNLKYRLLSIAQLIDLIITIYLNCCYVLLMALLRILHASPDINFYNKSKQEWLKSHFTDEKTEEQGVNNLLKVTQLVKGSSWYS